MIEKVEKVNNKPKGIIKLKKGSKEAKEYMAKLRQMRGKNKGKK